MNAIKIGTWVKAGRAVVFCGPVRKLYADGYDIEIAPNTISFFKTTEIRKVVATR
jgi:hypothetical protein